MLQLRLVDPNGYTVSVPGFETVVTVPDEDAAATEAFLLGEPAASDAAFWQGVARQNAEALGGPATVNGRNALAKVAYHSVSGYRVQRVQV